MLVNNRPRFDELRCNTAHHRHQCRNHGNEQSKQEISGQHDLKAGRVTNIGPGWSIKGKSNSDKKYAYQEGKD